MPTESNRITLFLYAAISLLVAATDLASAQAVQQYKLRSPTPGWDQLFGSSVATNGAVSIVGESFGGSNSTGTAHVYDLLTGNLIRTLNAADAGYIDNFGASVAISGNKILVGAPNDDVSSPNQLNSDSGSAYLFDAATGIQTFKLIPEHPSETGKFGRSVAIDGSRAIIGSTYGQSAFVFDTANGQQLFKLSPSDSSDSRFGHSVAIQGNRAVVGAPLYGSPDLQRGSAYVFDVATGEELFRLSTSEAIDDEWFGSSVAIDGSLAIVSAAGSDAAYVFDVNTGQLVRRLTAIDTLGGDQFGISVAIEGGFAAVSAVTSQGHSSAYLFDIATGSQRFKFDSIVPVSEDKFGGSNSLLFPGNPSIAIRGSRILVGAAGDDGTGSTPWNWGAAYGFTFSAVPEPHTSILALFACGLLNFFTRLRPARRFNIQTSGSEK